MALDVHYYLQEDPFGARVRHFASLKTKQKFFNSFAMNQIITPIQKCLFYFAEPGDGHPAGSGIVNILTKTESQE